MANNDAELNIGTKIDTKGAEEGLSKIEKLLKKFSKGNILKSLGSLGSVFTGIESAYKMASGAIKKVNAAIKDVEESYKTQARAEIQLETAAKNNPYLNGQSVKELKNYASEIQSFTTYGDEQLLPFMAELAAAGRTQSEIMDIMNAAVNAAASGAIDLGSAVQSLNMSFSGQAGHLAKIAPQIKNLTAEELKAGAAVKVIAQNYEGMAAAVADNLGTSEQLANAWGDLKEEIGAPFEKGAAPMRKFFTQLISGWTDALKKKREYEEADKKVKEGTASTNQKQIKLDAEIKQMESLKKSADAAKALIEMDSKDIRKSQAFTEWSVWNDGYIGEFVEYQNAIIKNYEASVALVEKLTAEIKEETEAEEKAAKAAAAADRASTAEKALAKYNETLAVKEREIELRKRAGEQISKEAEELEMANTMLQAYNQLIKDANGTITGKSSREQSKLDETGLLSALGNITGEMSASDALNTQIETLEKYYEAVQNSEYITQEKKKKYEEEYTQKHAELVKQREQLDKEEATARYQSHFETTQKLASLMDDYTKKYADIVSKSVDLAKDQVESEEAYKLLSLEKQYKEGLLSEEEYTKKKEQIEKESAEKTYQLEMWNWSTQILQATASGALAAVNALSTAGNIYAGIAMAAVATAMTGIELGAIMAAKPIKPSFEHGGIIPGNSYTGDHIAINANSREAVLTMEQQKRLLALADGKSGPGGGVVNIPISIENSVANEAQVDVTRELEGIKIMVRKQIQEDIASGLYNNQLMKAQGSYRGVRFTN